MPLLVLLANCNAPPDDKPAAEVSASRKAEDAVASNAADGAQPTGEATDSTAPQAEPTAKGAKKLQPALPAEVAPEASPRLASRTHRRRAIWRRRFSWVTKTNQRLHIQVDKPIYNPGESVWFRVWGLNSNGELVRDGQDALGIAEMEITLLSPQDGAVEQGHGRGAGHRLRQGRETPG